MTNPTLIYCYDAYCGWCYGFSTVMKRIAEEYADKFHIEVLSGGMILPEHERPISSMAPYIQKAHKTVEEYTGIRFGQDYLWHIFNPEQSDWFLNSEKPTATCWINTISRMRSSSPNSRARNTKRRPIMNLPW